MVGSELKAFTISNLFSAWTVPSRRRYVTLPKKNIYTLKFDNVAKQLKDLYLHVAIKNNAKSSKMIPSHM
jgi:hypothetical protein